MTIPTISVENSAGRIAPFVADEVIRELPLEQKEIAKEMIRDSEITDIHNMNAEAAKGINEIGKIVGGFTSKDIDIDHDPTSGTTEFSIWPRATNPVQSAGDFFPDTTGKLPRMVLQLVAIDPDADPEPDPIPVTTAWDWVRLVDDPEV